MVTDQQIEVMVYQRFPKIESEFRCATERRERQAAREAYRAKLKAGVETPADCFLYSIKNQTDVNI
jgi:hypothetical protein